MIFEYKKESETHRKVLRIWEEKEDSRYIMMDIFLNDSEVKQLCGTLFGIEPLSENALKYIKKELNK